MRVYVDTNVWIDFLDMGRGPSERFFRALADCRFTAVISDLVIQELIGRDAYDTSFLDGLRRNEKLVVVPVSSRVRALARTLPTHYADAIHAAVALEYAVPVLTWNVNDFAIPGLAIMTPNDIK